MLELQLQENIDSELINPEEIFVKLDNYIVALYRLSNIEPISPRQIETKTLGIVSITEKLGEKNITLAQVKEDFILYQATKTKDWSINTNYLEQSQIEAIRNLPSNGEEILIDFYSRNLTENLKNIFRARKYPISEPISLNVTSVPYKFEISVESRNNYLVFVGFDDSNTLIFKSCLNNSGNIQIVHNSVSLEHLNQLAEYSFEQAIRCNS
jgi:hypothetical protein